MRTFIYEFLSTPFLDEELDNANTPYCLFEEILSRAKIEEKEIDLIYLSGVDLKDGRKLFSRKEGTFLYLENRTSSVISGFLSAIDLLKSNKAEAILFISLNKKKKKNPFLNYKLKYLKEAKRFGINKTLIDEILIKSYFKYEQFYSKEVCKEIMQPIVIEKKNPELHLNDHFFMKGITREILNLSNLLSQEPWEIFTKNHFAESATGGSAILLVNEEFSNERNLKNIAEICFFDFIKKHRVYFPQDLIETLGLTKEFSYKAVFSSTPCVIEEAMIRGFFSDFDLHKEYLGAIVYIDDINPFGSELFWGWADGTNFLRRLGFLKSYLYLRKGKGLIIEKIPFGPDILMEILVL